MAWTMQHQRSKCSLQADMEIHQDRPHSASKQENLRNFLKNGNHTKYFSDHKGVKLEINRKITGKSPKILEVTQF